MSRITWPKARRRCTSSTSSRPISSCSISACPTWTGWSVDARVSGLDGGADDYLPKPFETPELIARLRVIERRLSTTRYRRIVAGNVSLDTVSHQAFLDDEPVDLPRREYMVLKSLMENIGKVQTRQQLENRLYAWGEEVASNAIEVHVHHLRKKLGNDLIKTVRGVGYTIRPS